MNEDRDFSRALAATLQFEGGYANHPADPGGATMRGVTQATFWEYLRDHGRPVRDVRTITDAEVRDIYRARYWDKVTKGRTWPLNAVLFDMAVNHGPTNALWMLEQAKKRVSPTHPDRMRALALAVCDERVRFFHNIVRRRPLSAVFLRGWLRRAAAFRVLANS